jgi:exopolysaccharide production protein ExoQ
MANEFIHSAMSALSSSESHGQRAKNAATHPVRLKRLSWFVAVFVVLVQEGAFVNSSVFSAGATAGSSDAANALNTIAIFLNIMLIAPFCVIYFRHFTQIIFGNKAMAALTLVIFLSIAWSLHPDITLRRDINYLSTVLTACYLAARFDIDEIMEILSWGIGIAAIFSFIFVATFPIDAIHQSSSWQLTEGDDIAGSWKGVFAHKNGLGHTMALGIIVELYILITGNTRRLWHGLLLIACLLLVIFSRSSTALVLTCYYFLGGVLLIITQHAKQYFSIALTILIVTVSTFLVIYWADPDLVWAMLGRDPTLTGRTVLWTLVLNLIWEHPLLGWGYGAMWLPNDPVTLAISEAVGWQVPQAHNALLEVMLEMGIVGLILVFIFIGNSLWRSGRLIAAGKSRFGMITFLLFLGAAITGSTEANLVQNQAIEWVMLSALSFRCGLEITRLSMAAKTW